MAFVNEKTEDGKWQTIDRERNVVLRIVRGPHPDYGYQFELSLDDQIIKFSGHSGMKIHGSPKLGEPRRYEMNWDFSQLFVPEDIQKEKGEILTLIREALETYGDSYNTEKAASVSVKFDPRLV